MSRARTVKSWRRAGCTSASTAPPGLGMDGPVPGLMTDDYEPDAAICSRIVADGLVAGARRFIADIEAPSDAMDTPAYEYFRPARLHAAVRANALGGDLMHASIWRFGGDPDE